MEHATPDQIATWVAAFFVGLVKAYERFLERPKAKRRALLIERHKLHEKETAEDVP